MPTTFIARNTASTLGGAGQLLLSQRYGRTITNAVTTTTVGGTNIQLTQTAGGQALTWFTEPIAEAVTISGSLTVWLSGRESATTVNAGAGVLIERCDNAGTVLSTILADTTIPPTITEWGTSNTQRTASYTPTSTSMAVGERIKVTFKVRNVGTMAAGTVTNTYGDVSNTSNNSQVQFAEDIITDERIEVSLPEIFGSNGYRV